MNWYPRPEDRADQLALGPERGTQRRNLRLQIILINHPVGPHACHQGTPAYHLAARLISAISTSKARPPSLIGWPSAKSSRRRGNT